MTDHRPHRDLDFRLGERIKELNALHRTARILHDDELPAADLVARVADLLPQAWQYPETTGAMIRFADICVTTPGFSETAWLQEASFTTRTGESGVVRVCYREPRPQEYEGPFLAEERELIDSLAQMLRSFFQRRLALQAFERTRDQLEEQVARRTAELNRTNQTLKQQVQALEEARRHIEEHHQELRRLASELSLSEARQRRSIAVDLHDHIGQALAFIRIRIATFRGDAMFCGFDKSLEEIDRLLDQTIRYTRDLTFEISPPVLYELGLASALEWLAEHFGKKHGLTVKLALSGPPEPLPEDLKVTCYKVVAELLTNIVKHAGVDRAWLSLTGHDDQLRITVRDDGIGFDPAITDLKPDPGHGFGLFSIRERVRCLGGETEMDAAPGRGVAVTLTLPVHQGDAP